MTQKINRTNLISQKYIINSTRYDPASSVGVHPNAIITSKFPFDNNGLFLHIWFIVKIRNGICCSEKDQNNWKSIFNIFSSFINFWKSMCGLSFKTIHIISIAEDFHVHLLRTHIHLYIYAYFNRLTEISSTRRKRYSRVIFVIFQFVCRFHALMFYYMRLICNKILLILTNFMANRYTKKWILWWCNDAYK